MKLQPSTAGKKIFLTGGNGVVGRALVRELGAENIVFLQYSKRIDQPNAHVVSGDITRPRLGLSRSDYGRLAREIGIVIHCAAITNLHDPIDITRNTNVEGTRNVVAFAELAGAPLVHVSTAFVSDRVLGCGIEGKSSYRDSKQMGEALVRNCGVPWTIVRPSLVVGDTADGAMPQFQGFHTLVAYFLKGVIPMIPATPASICDFVPRDMLAQVIGAIIREQAYGEDYWITAGHRAVPLQRMMELITAFAARRGRPIELPRSIDPDSVVRLFLPVFMPTLPRRERLRIERLFEYARYFDVRDPFPSSLPELERRGWIKAPTSFESLFERNMDYWADTTGFAGRPRRQVDARERSLMQEA